VGLGRQESRGTLRDAQGRPIIPGARVRWGSLVGTVRHVEPGYGVLTLVVEARTGKSERMVRARDVEVVQEGAVIGEGADPGPARDPPSAPEQPPARDRH
jgi:hypothetical protein